MPKYVYSKIKWDLSIYDLSETWVKENIDSNLNRLYRKWLQFPFSANITHLHMPQNKLGLDITSAKNLYNEYKLSVRRILKTSPNLEGRKLTKSQALNMLIQTQSQIKLLPWSPKNTRLKRTVVKSLTITITKNMGRFHTIEGTKQHRSVNHNTQQQQRNIQVAETCQKSSNNLHNFCRKYLVASLANRTNLKRWKISENNNCELCNCPETQLHIFNNCKLALNRYEWRHN